MQVDNDAFSFANVSDAIRHIRDGGNDISIVHRMTDPVQAALQQMPRVIHEHINRQLSPDHQQRRLTLNELVGNTPVRGDVKFPGMASGMLNIYWSPIHQAFMEDEELASGFRELFGADFVFDPNRLRLVMPKSGLAESIHTDHNCLDPNRIPMPAAIVALSNTRTFTFYEGTGSPEFLRQLAEQYRDILSPRRHYVTFPIKEGQDPLGLLPRKRTVTMRAGDILFFNTNMVHEVCKNKLNTLQFSLFLSPRMRSNEPKFLALARRSRYERACLTPEVPDDIATVNDANKLTWLLGVAPIVWPSGKPVFHVSTQALGSWHHRASQACTVPLPPGNHYVLQSPPVRNVVWKDLDVDALEALDIPTAAFRGNVWANNPLSISRELQVHLGFRSIC